MTLEDNILEECRRLGFAAAGFASAGAAETFALYRRWLDSGRAAGMAYLQRHAGLRANPDLIAPGTRSVIVVAARYPVNTAASEGVSSYARGRDYHTVVRKKLKKLVAFLQQQHAIQSARICVDSAPVLEREWALRAGIGWRGRQGQIINPAFGSCFVIGEVLVDVPLAPSTRQENRCGTCRQCVEACPTGAINGEGLVDARKCRSYLTIEHAGDIAPEDSPLLGQALFGCDLCTAVCPWNRFGDNWVMPEFRGENDLRPEDFLVLSEEDFRQRFQGTSLYRTGLLRLQRNARIALKNRA